LSVLDCLPMVTAISNDIIGGKLLVTLRVAGKANDKDAIGHLEGIGYGLRHSGSLLPCRLSYTRRIQWH
jgi:hypothetical protein